MKDQVLLVKSVSANLFVSVSGDKSSLLFLLRVGGSGGAEDGWNLASLEGGDQETPLQREICALLLGS